MTDETKRKLRSTLTPVLAMLAVVLIAGGVIFIATDAANRAREQATRNANAKLNERTREISFQLALTAWKAQLGGCSRGNALRRAIDDTARTTTKFLKAALTARQAAVTAASDPAVRKLNQDAANVYIVLIGHQHIVPLIDCKASFPKPDFGGTP